jgi:hypothetical protein
MASRLFLKQAQTSLSRGFRRVCRALTARPVVVSAVAGVALSALLALPSAARADLWPTVDRCGNQVFVPYYPPPPMVGGPCRWPGAIVHRHRPPPPPPPPGYGPPPRGPWGYPPPPPPRPPRPW